MPLELKDSSLLKALGGGISQTLNSNLPYTFFLISVAIVIAFFLVVYLINKRVASGALLTSLIVGKDNRLSISKLQGVIWTLISIVSFITLKMLSTNCGVPIETEIPANLLILMGINYTTMVLAKGITSQSINKGSVKTTAARSSISDIYNSDDNTKTDLVKFQMLCWTIVAIVVYFLNFFAQFYGEVTTIGFPNVDNSLIMLMLIGQGAYLGDKAVNINKPKIERITPLLVSPGEPFSITGLFAQDETTFIANRTVPLKVLDWNTTVTGKVSARVSLPDNIKLTSTPVEIIATTNGLLTDPYYIIIDSNYDQERHV